MKLHLLFLSLHQSESASLGINCAFWLFYRIITFTGGGEKNGHLQNVVECKGTEQEGKSEATAPSLLNELMSPIPFSYKNVHQLVCLRLKWLCVICSHTF